MKQLAPAASALALILAACSPEAPAPADAPAAESPAAGAAVPAGIRAALLEDDGVTLTDPAGGAGRKLAFSEDAGDARTDVVAYVTRLNGGQPLRSGSNEECGAGAQTFVYLGDWFELAFIEDRLAGWTVSEGAPAAFATASGVHVGSTVAELRAAHPDVTVETNTLGPEFAAGEVYGFLSGTNDAATITSMWAGVNCVFR
jgi:hypothetical protein